MKKIVSCFLAFLVISFSTISVSEEMPQRIFDNAMCFTENGPTDEIVMIPDLDSYVESSMELMMWHRENNGFDFAILTIDDFIGYETHASLAEAFYEQMDLGIGPNKSGVLFLIDINQKCAYMYVEGDCKSWLTHDMRQAIISELEEAIESHFYSTTLSVATLGINSAWRVAFMGAEFIYFD